MRRIEVIVIGGGQAGLAMSRCLAERRVDHVVLERGRVAERWRSERWDSLRLLTPRWQSRLPGHRYEGPDPHGFMTRRELIGYLEGYARSFDAPVLSGTCVRALEPAEDGYRVQTDRGDWVARAVVIATGDCDVPHVPAMATRVAGEVVQLAPTAYRNPSQLPDGGVLVVGASATGLQLADELERSGRAVTLSVGRHTRMPRRYRGRDIMGWLDRVGVLDERAHEVPDLEASRRQPSLQLVGRPDHRTLDLPALAARGVRLAGRAVEADGARIAFADDLAATTAAADAKLERLLARIDALAGLDPLEPARPFARLHGLDAPRELDLAAEGIRTVIWATGFRRRYPWLRVPILDACGELRHDGGVTPAAGLYVIGLRFLRRRKSSFLDGVGADAEELSAHVAAYLGRRETWMGAQRARRTSWVNGLHTTS